jgi:hypothetical protein
VHGLLPDAHPCARLGKGGDVTAVEPVYVFDAYAPDRWRFYSDEVHPRFLAWLRQQGLNPRVIWRFEVYLVDCPSIRVFEYLPDDDGLPYCRLDHDHRPGARCEMAEREPYEVPADSLAPIYTNGPETASPVRPVVGCPDDPITRPGAPTGPHSRISRDARQHGNEGT